MLRKILLFTSLFICLHAFPQQNAIDFTLTDTQGNTYNLFSELALGKTVVLDFFSVHCGVCIMHAPKTDSLWQKFGSNGENMWIWGIEALASTNAEIDTFRLHYGATYPGFSTENNPEIVSDYGVTSTPIYFVICPDKKMKEINFEYLESMILHCESVEVEEIKENNRTPQVLFDSYGKTIKIINLDYSKNYSVNIYNSLGNNLVSRDNAEIIEIGNLSSGLYIIKLTYDNYTYSKLIQIQE